MSQDVLREEDLANKEADVNSESADTADEVQTESDSCEAVSDEKDAVTDEEVTEETAETEEVKKKDPKDAAIEELQDKVKRQMAEFDNFRKRTEKEKSAMFEMGASDIIKKLLPIVDNFDRGFNGISDEQLEEPFIKGMDMVRKQLMKMLEEAGVAPIEAVGIEFNPDFHNAVMHVEDESVGENIIVEEFEKGYTYRETVIRHSMVKVAN